MCCCCKITQLENNAGTSSGNGEVQSPTLLFDKFIERVRKHLHIVLLFNPIDKNFRSRLRMFPALINCCTIDWFHVNRSKLLFNIEALSNIFNLQNCAICKQEWPDQALELVANRYFDDIEMNDTMRQQCVDVCKGFHQSVISLSNKYYEELKRTNYVTPTSYMELIRTFKDLLDKKRVHILRSKERYSVGIEKLELAEQAISVMQRELTDLQPKMLESREESERLIAVIEREAKELDIVKRKVEEDGEKADRATKEAKAIKHECEEDLKVALPALNDAVNALKTLKPQDISRILASNLLFQTLLVT